LVSDFSLDVLINVEGETNATRTITIKELKSKLYKDMPEDLAHYA